MNRVPRRAVRLEDPEGGIALFDEVEAFYVQPSVDLDGKLILRLYARMRDASGAVLVKTFTDRFDAIWACCELEVMRLSAIAEKSDVLVFVVGEHGYIDREGSVSNASRS